MSTVIQYTMFTIYFGLVFNEITLRQSIILFFALNLDTSNYDKNKSDDECAGIKNSYPSPKKKRRKYWSKLMSSTNASFYVHCYKL